MAFKIFRKNCCGLDVHKTWIYACIGITDTDGRTEYKQARFSSFSKGLGELCDWLAKYHCFEVCMESTGKYWMPFFNILERAILSVVLAHPKYTKPQKGNKTDHKDAKWICDLLMCDMVKQSFIPPADPSPQGSGTIPVQTHLYDYWRKEPCTELFYRIESQTKRCLQRRFGEVFPFHYRTAACPSQEFFDVASFVDSRCKAPIEKIQAAVDGVISPEQAVKLGQSLNHIDELEKHINETTQEILRLSNRYSDSTVIH